MQEMFSSAEVSKMLKISKKSVRAYIKGERIGGRVIRYSRAQIEKLTGGRYSRAQVEKLMGGGYGPSPVPEDLRVYPDYRRLAWEAQRSWTVNERAALCDQKTDILYGTVASFLVQDPDGDVMSDAFVAYALANLPVGGGAIGNALRTDIQAEAKLRGIR